MGLYDEYKNHVDGSDVKLDMFMSSVEIFQAYIELVKNQTYYLSNDELKVIAFQMNVRIELHFSDHSPVDVYNPRGNEVTADGVTVGVVRHGGQLHYERYHVIPAVQDINGADNCEDAASTVIITGAMGIFSKSDQSPGLADENKISKEAMRLRRV